jgi:hypothetical protein
MKERDLIRIIESAFVYKLDEGCDIPDEGCDISVIDCLLENVCQMLRSDPRLSRLCRQEFDALLAAFDDGARRLLGEYARMAQHIDWGYVARIMTDAVIYEMNHEFGADDGGEP